MGKIARRPRHRRYLAIVAAPPAGGRPRDYLLAPWLADLPAQNREILPLLPVAGLNETTLSALPDRALPARPVLALMLADPFLRVRDVRPRLARAGIGRVANFPTVGLIDGDAARALDAAGLGPEREAAALAAFAAAGVAAVAFACDLRAARALLAVRLAMLVLHPGVALSDWRQRAAAAAALAKVVTALRAETALPLLVYRPRGYGAELDGAIAAADGEASVDG